MKNIKSLILATLSLCYLSSCNADLEYQDQIIANEVEHQFEERAASPCNTGCILPGFISPGNLTSSTNLFHWEAWNCGFWKITPSSKFRRCGKVTVSVFNSSCQLIDSFQTSANNPFTISYSDYPSTYCDIFTVALTNKCGSASFCLANDYTPGPIPPGAPYFCYGC